MSVHFCSCTCMVCQPTVAYMQSKLFWQSTGSFLKYDLTSVLIVVIIRGTGMWTEKEMMNKAQVSYLTEEKTRMKRCTQGTVCLLLWCPVSYIQWHVKKWDLRMRGHRKWWNLHSISACEFTEMLSIFETGLQLPVHLVLMLSTQVRDVDSVILSVVDLFPLILNHPFLKRIPKKLALGTSFVLEHWLVAVL